MMGTLSLTLTGVGSTWVLPQTLIQVQFAQGTLLGDATAKKVLLIGPKTTSGTATAGTAVYPLPTEAEAIAQFGTGSPIHRMYRRFAALCKTAPIYGICPTESVGTAASVTLTVTGTAGGAGVTDITIAGEKIGVTIASGDTAIAHAAAIAAAINAQTHLPVTAAVGGGGSEHIVTVTNRVKGTNGNWVRFRVSTTSGITTAVALSAALPVNGATDEVYTTSLATILATKYDFIVPGINPTGTSDTRYAALSTQVQTQKLPTSGIRQQTIICTGASLANATTFVTAYNKAENQVIWQENPDWEPMEVAASLAAVRYLKESSAPWQNYDFYGLKGDDNWPVPVQYSEGDHPTKTEQNTAIGVGLTPLAVDDSKTKTYVVMSVTAAGADPRIRDTAKVAVCFQFAEDLAARYASQWSRAGVADNEPDGAIKLYGPGVCTPSRLKNLTIIPLLYQYADKLPVPYLVNVEGTAGTIAGTATGIDPVVVTRINAQIPLQVTPLLHQAQFLINEVSSG